MKWASQCGAVQKRYGSSLINCSCRVPTIQLDLDMFFYERVFLVGVRLMKKFFPMLCSPK